MDRIILKSADKRRKQGVNPFLPLDKYIPDGEPHVFEGRVYLYGSHDREGGHTFCMEDYEVFSAAVEDLTQWRSEGVIYRAEQDPLYGKFPYMYAPDCVRGNDGRYYLYYCMSGEYGQGGYHNPISVAVCDEPAGKFEYLGQVHWKDGQVMRRYVCFDPAVMNDDGVIRLYYGTQYGYEEEPDFLASGRLQDEVEMFGRSAEEILAYPDSINGAIMLTLEDDMLTVREEPRHIIPYRVKETDFEGHPFFEASSMRKVGAKYYFIYSSWQNHELCYAVSDFPDKEFRFGGTIVSNGDVGAWRIAVDAGAAGAAEVGGAAGDAAEASAAGVEDGGVTGIARDAGAAGAAERPAFRVERRGERECLNMTGTTHGSILQINGQWYVFYHRLTHKSDYSRQACAERIEISEDGTIRQVEVTSCGLNGGPLAGDGCYPAVICCNLTNGRMPHGCNCIYKEEFPNVTNQGDERFIAEIEDGTLIGYKYWEFEKGTGLAITARIENEKTRVTFNGQARVDERSVLDKIDAASEALVPEAAGEAGTYFDVFVVPAGSRTGGRTGSRVGKVLVPHADRWGERVGRISLDGADPETDEWSRFDMEGEMPAGVYAVYLVFHSGYGTGHDSGRGTGDDSGYGTGHSCGDDSGAGREGRGGRRKVQLKEVLFWK